MKKLAGVLIVPGLLLAVCVSTMISAQEPAGQPPILSIAEQAKTTLKAGQIIALFLNGNDALFTRVMEDALSIQLSNAHFVVVNREKLEKSVGTQIAKLEKESGGAVSALEVGRTVGANLVLTGTAIVEFPQDRPLRVRVGSFQLIDVATEKTLVAFLSEPEKGESLSAMSGAFVSIIRENMK
jgi:hypothetical protein